MWRPILRSSNVPKKSERLLLPLTLVYGIYLTFFMPRRRYRRLAPFPWYEAVAGPIQTAAGAATGDLPLVAGGLYTSGQGLYKTGQWIGSKRSAPISTAQPIVKRVRLSLPASQRRPVPLMPYRRRRTRRPRRRRRGASRAYGRRRRSARVPRNAFTSHSGNLFPPTAIVKHEALVHMDLPTYAGTTAAHIFRMNDLAVFSDTTPAGAEYQTGEVSHLTEMSTYYTTSEVIGFKLVARMCTTPVSGTANYVSPFQLFAATNTNTVKADSLANYRIDKGPGEVVKSTLFLETSSAGNPRMKYLTIKTKPNHVIRKNVTTNYLKDEVQQVWSGADTLATDAQKKSYCHVGLNCEQSATAGGTHRFDIMIQWIVKWTLPRDQTHATT